MLVRTTRTISTLTLRALFYAALFGIVVVAHLGISGVLRAQGWGSNVSLLVAGAMVLVFVVLASNAAEWLRDRLHERREKLRAAQRLPSGPCCVVWRAPEAPTVRELLDEDDDYSDMPWDVVGPLRARYPRLARRLGVEGVAVAEFEVGADGRAKNISCVDVWPSDVFFDAAREALQHARFEPKDVHVRFGASYKMPFVFRIAGASKARDAGRRARNLNPALHAAQQAVQKLRERSGAA
ncbi:MAG: energy transducer TonB [Caulobacteraceae bacterium]